MGLRYTQAARKHKIGRARIEYVIKNPYVVFAIPPPNGSQQVRMVYLGDDQTGRALEIMTVPVANDELVIHAMDLRSKYQIAYREGKKATGNG